MTYKPSGLNGNQERKLQEAFTLKRLPYTEHHNDRERERKWEWDERKYLDRIWPSDPA